MLNRASYVKTRHSWFAPDETTPTSPSSQCSPVRRGLTLDPDHSRLLVGDHELGEGALITVDGGLGDVYAGEPVVHHERPDAAHRTGSWLASQHTNPCRTRHISFTQDGFTPPVNDPRCRVAAFRLTICRH